MSVISRLRDPSVVEFGRVSVDRANEPWRTMRDKRLTSHLKQFWHRYEMFLDCRSGQAWTRSNTPHRLSSLLLAAWQFETGDARLPACCAGSLSSSGVVLVDIPERAVICRIDLHGSVI